MDRCTAVYILFADLPRRLAAEAWEIIAELGRERNISHKNKGKLVVCYLNVPSLVMIELI